MQREVFEKKAKQFGDFVIFYQKTDKHGNVKVHHTVASYELDNPYIVSKMRNTAYDAETKALMWNWNADRRLIVDYSRIKKLVPLASVLKNHR